MKSLVIASLTILLPMQAFAMNCTKEEAENANNPKHTICEKKGGSFQESCPVNSCPVTTNSTASGKITSVTNPIISTPTCKVKYKVVSVYYPEDGYVCKQNAQGNYVYVPDSNPNDCPQQTPIDFAAAQAQGCTVAVYK